MNLVTFKKTGHVLAAVTRISQPDKAPTVEEIAQGGFRMRKSNGDRSLLVIPETEISVKQVDYSTEVLHRPQLFAVEDDLPVQKTGSTGLTVVLNGSTIQVTLPANVSSSTNVWCQISGGALTEPIVRSVTIQGTVAAPTKTGTESLVLGSGAYLVALFAPGYGVAVIEQNVP